MLIKNRIARVQPSGLFGGVFHVALVAPNTSRIAAGASGRTKLLLLEVRWLLGTDNAAVSSS